jgi:capsid protein
MKSISNVVSNIFAGWHAVEKTKHTHKIERTGEGGILKPKQRLLGVAANRDLERNFSTAKSIQWQYKVNVVGASLKMMVNCEGGKAAADWFNKTWAKSADFKDETTHFTTLVENMLTTVRREGDCAICVDDKLFENSGKILAWESDQIVKLSEKAFKNSPWSKIAFQDNGLLRHNVTDKIIGIIITGQHGATSIDDISKVQIMPIEDVRLIKAAWRLNQGRGTADMLTAKKQFEDVYEIQNSELDTAIRTSKQAGYTKRKDPESGDNTPRITPLDEEEGDEIAEIVEVPKYDKFEELYGGNWHYLHEGDEVGVIDNPRPNMDIIGFSNAVLAQAGSSQGLAKCYTLLQASSSYTAFRGEMLMSWATFYWWQQWAERMICDWIAVKVLTWAIKKGKIKALPEGWESSISWQWPKMPEIDMVKAAMSDRANLKNGKMDFADLIGPDWDNKLTSLQEQLAKFKGLPLSVFETVSGSIIEDLKYDGNSKDEE